jgi:hypothetical protein
VCGCGRICTSGSVVRTSGSVARLKPGHYDRLSSLRSLQCAAAAGSVPPGQ